MEGFSDLSAITGLLLFVVLVLLLLGREHRDTIRVELVAMA